MLSFQIFYYELANSLAIIVYNKNTQHSFINSVHIVDSKD